MATSQMVKQENSGNWSALFPAEQMTERQSALFAKKLLAVAISNITYLRAIFPERAYGDRCLGDLNLKILKDDASCPGASQLIKWVKGCFDALDKQYLRTLIIGIYVDPDDSDTLIESYTFKFSYSTQCGVEIFRNGKKITSANSTEETKRATIRMLHTIIVLTQTMDPLPDNVMMTMKILYYDEVTPPCYEPPGFKPALYDTFEYEDEMVNVKLGDVSTPFHCVKMRIKTKKSQFDFNDDAPEEKNLESATISNSGLDHDGESQQQLKDNENLKATSTCAAATPVEDVSHSKPDTGRDSDEPKNKSAKEDEYNVRCPCGCNEDDGLMIVCDVCSLWQHAVCFRILDEDHAPEVHICDVCAKVSATRKPTDPYLNELDTYAVQATCLWRRTIAAAAEFTRILPHQLANRLGCDSTVAQGLVLRLQKEGFALTPNKGTRLGKVVDREKLKKEGIPAYFYYPEKQAKTTKEVSQVTERAAGISLSSNQLQTEKLKPEISILRNKDVTVQKENKPKGRKRAFSKRDQREFDLSGSQESNFNTRSLRKRKCSDANKTLVL